MGVAVTSLLTVVAMHRAWVEKAGAKTALVVAAQTAPATLAGPDNRSEGLHRSWINPAGHTRASHGSSLCLLPNGEIVAIWYGGEREGAADVAIYLSRRGPEPDAAWSAPEVLLTTGEAEADVGRNIRKLGNAVAFADPQGTLWLAYVSVSLGGWSGSAISLKRSYDGGRTWTASERLTLNPFLNFSSLVRAKPFFTTDGWIGLPIYHEFVHKFPQMLWFRPSAEGGESQFHVRRLPESLEFLQPAVVPLDPAHAVMFLRDSGPTGTLHFATSSDAGWSWTSPQPQILANPDSGIDVVRLRTGELVLAYNDTREGRHRLRLAVSRDGGQSWQEDLYLEEHTQGEYSYPSIAVDGAGDLHISYTWNRERIRHVQLSPAQLLSARPAFLAGTPR